METLLDLPAGSPERLLMQNVLYDPIKEFSLNLPRETLIGVDLTGIAGTALLESMLDAYFYEDASAWETDTQNLQQLNLQSPTSQ